MERTHEQVLAEYAAEERKERAKRETLEAEEMTARAREAAAQAEEHLLAVRAQTQTRTSKPDIWDKFLGVHHSEKQPLLYGH